MTSVKTQAISGVTTDAENISMKVYPSMAGTGLGRLLGNLYESIPIKINGIKLSHLLFPLPLSPLSLLIYFWMKAFGDRFVLTNRSLQVWRGLGARMSAQVPLGDIKEIDVAQSPGQVFYKAGDLVLFGANDSRLLRLGGVPRPDVFRQTILKGRDARLQNDSALATIRARKPA